MMAYKDDRKTFAEKIGASQDRRMKSQRDKTPNIWFGLGIIGSVGWSIAVPTIVGVVLGHWLDSRWQSGFSWTLTLLITGLVLGCFNAWYWVSRQLREIHKKKDDE